MLPSPQGNVLTTTIGSVPSQRVFSPPQGVFSQVEAIHRICPALQACQVEETLRPRSLLQGQLACWPAVAILFCRAWQWEAGPIFLRGSQRKRSFQETGSVRANRAFSIACGLLT